MLNGTQLRRWVDAFGVPAGQIERDHLVSHVLARLPEMPLDATFFGGSALCRTHLPDWRLSEDIDLLVPTPARAAGVLGDRLPGLLSTHATSSGLVAPRHCASRRRGSGLGGGCGRGGHGGVGGSTRVDRRPG